MNKAEKANKDAATNWLLHSESVGISSETMARTIAGLEWRGPFQQDIPHDVGDFGRCVGLIERLPYPDTALKSCAKLTGKWPEIIKQWDRLVDLYDNDKSWDGDCNKNIRAISTH